MAPLSIKAPSNIRDVNHKKSQGHAYFPLDPWKQTTWIVTSLQNISKSQFH